jgi:hypothetical protein
VKFVFKTFLLTYIRFCFLSVHDEQEPISDMGYVLQLCPQLDILGCIKEAKYTHKLVLTIPWVVKYLSMMDPVSAHLPYYNAVFGQLFGIYQDMQLPGRASLLIRLLLGWLFESSSFPEGLFYAWRQDLNVSTTLDTGYYSLSKLLGCYRLWLSRL